MTEPEGVGLFQGLELRVRAGLRPAQIFNATLVETGDRFTMGTVDLPALAIGGREPRDVSFYGLYRGLDLAPVTAARVSATFPYVTPVSRPENVQVESSYHMADGGYYDNFGIVSATLFLTEALRTSPRKRALLIQIDDGLPTEDDRTSSQRGWFFQTFAPLNTLLKVRDRSQRARNDLDVKLLEEILHARGVALTVARFSYPGPDAPLSWHLTQDEKSKLDLAWKQSLAKPETKKVITFLQELN
ncbi:hypothetical protein [uncultured Paludibaculum sp.]|uniref:hypothetical protein n=1 Tax=uncultured Paludibaculum sp. TaxID=1765020 RepID=UPI002AABDA0C|nr:hypothetical protein [uncultured Paludibaculum sp.]